MRSLLTIEFICILSSFSKTARTHTQLHQQTNPAFLTGLYNQYLLQQSNTQQLNTLNSSNGNNSAAFSDKIDDSGDLKSSNSHTHASNQAANSPMENNLMLQINADKQSSTTSTTNNEILQQLYNYSQMSGELIK